ncbi:alkaline phosphatase family protein [Lunatibacter salilacus]|uniref:hypothetical protein n=1 Tax=Lunatibacter salilacus TaxID=2483804 RepID=UPI001F416707|nr:hypothetical protein [Lunatibacter salilacus]
MISFVDFAPTLLSLVGVAPKSYMQGQAFLGDHQPKEERKYIHAAADRFDEVTDAIRAVRDKQFKYIRNYRPNQGYYLPLSYRERMPTMQELLRLKESDKLDSIQSQWFRGNKHKEEIYDCKADPDELNNLAENPNYQDKLWELSQEMDRWLIEIGDDPELSEKELITQLWGGEESQPKTDDPLVKIENGKINITSNTNGASIGYKIIHENGQVPQSWTIYKEAVDIRKVDSIQVSAHQCKG